MVDWEPLFQAGADACFTRAITPETLLQSIELMQGRGDLIR
jgi:hypothetical protein